MASGQQTVDFILEQMAGAGPVTARKMFGEYAIFLDGMVVALVCNDALFLKGTPGAQALYPDAVHEPPYAGARPHLRLEAELDDPDRLAAAVRAVAGDLPTPKPKVIRPKAPKSSNRKPKTP